MKGETMRSAVCLSIFLTISAFAFGSGHGPVFGLATPTNSQGETSIDISTSTRIGSAGNDLGIRTMVTYGFTPHLQFSIAAPGNITSTNLPASRSMGGDLEGTLGWRFHHRGPKVGTRFESTLFTGLVVPNLQRSPGMMGLLKRAPGVSTGVVTGMASRSHYVWVGAGLTHYFERGGDQRPQVAQYSVVYGYRPPFLRKEYDHWDWRIFGEMVGERGSDIRHSGVIFPGSNTHQIFAGPTTLGIYKSFAISGGVLFPIYRENGLYPQERARVAVNLSYFIFHFSGDHK
jgi:hypothetical protein